MSDEITQSEIEASIAANSLQFNADDIMTGYLDLTIVKVKKGPSKEQPISIEVAESTKVYNPSKTFRRVLVACFTDVAKNWEGQKIRIYRNPLVTWGGVQVGGLEISHASIAAPIVLMLALKRGKKQQHKIDVLPTQKAAPKAKAAPAPVAAPEPKPEAKPHARGTISGDAEEGNLDGHLPPSHPAKDDMDKMLAAFAKIGMDSAAVEKKYSKKLSEWTLADMSVARDLFVLLSEFKKIGMDSAAVEREYNKPIKDWSMEDFTEAREVFKECKADWELKQAAEATQDLI